MYLKYSIFYQMKLLTSQISESTFKDKILKTVGENNPFSCPSGSTAIYFGAKGQYKYITPDNLSSQHDNTTNYTCSDEWFGDPNPGNKKNCYCVGDAVDVNNINGTILKTVGEGKSFSCPSNTTDVYFGRDTKYKHMTAADLTSKHQNTTNYQCSDEWFGDPDSGYRKSCYCVEDAAEKTKLAKEAAEKAKEAAEKAELAIEAKERSKLAKIQKKEESTISQIKSLTEQIQALQNSSQNLEQDVSVRSSDIQTAQTQLQQQKQLLIDKRNLLITRNRMLQLSQDRNNYKQKVIFSLLALIIACFLIILAGYGTYKKLSS